MSMHFGGQAGAQLSVCWNGWPFYLRTHPFRDKGFDEFRRRKKDEKEGITQAVVIPPCYNLVKVTCLETGVSCMLFTCSVVCKCSLNAINVHVSQSTATQAHISPSSDSSLATVSYVSLIDEVVLCLFRW